MGCGMPGTKRILTVFGTRPEAIKLFPLIRALETDDRFDSRVCVSGQHRGMLDQVLDISGVVPHYDLDLMQPDQTLAERADKQVYYTRGIWPDQPRADAEPVIEEQRRAG